MDLADKNKDYNVVDNLLEEIGLQHRFTQTLKFYNIKYHTLVEETNLF